MNRLGLSGQDFADTTDPRRVSRAVFIGHS